MCLLDFFQKGKIMLQRGYLIKRMLSSARDLHVHQSGIAKKKTYLISAVGKDEIGLVHGISKLLSDHGGSISESRWATFGGDFVAFMNVHFPKVTEKEKECEVDKNNMRKGAKMKDIKEMLKEKFPAMHISIHSGTEMMVSEEHKKYYRVSACGPDVGGLIRDFSDSFQSAGISVLDMSTVSSFLNFLCVLIFEKVCWRSSICWICKLQHERYYQRSSRLFF
jgi:glycine cleavage system regulatory protein